MEGNTYFLPLRNAKRYTPYEFDNMMSHNENRMDKLGKIIDLDIYNCMMADRRTPLVLTPKLILDNSNGINSIGGGSKYKSNNFTTQSQQIFRNPLKEISNDSFKIEGSPKYINQPKYRYEENNKFNQFDPEEELNSRNWRYEEPSRLKTERNIYQRNLHRDNEPVKIKQNKFNMDLYNRNNRNNNYPDNNYYNNNNNTLRSQEIPRSRSNDYMMRRPTPYNDGYNDRNSYGNNRYNNENYDDGNNEYKNRNYRPFNPERNDSDIKKNENYNDNNKDNSNYVRRGYYNSQLNFPFDRFED